MGTENDEPRRGAQEPAAGRAYRELERLIVTLELGPGTVTTEGALIERLGLGRTPVREAVQRLAWEGLITVRPRAGLEIAPLDPADWIRVLDARSAIEAVLARSAARWVGPDAITSLKKAALEMHEAVLSRDVRKFLDADKSLDEAIAQACDNPFAVRLAAPLQTHSRRFWYRYRGDTGLAEAAEHHVALITAITNRDPGVASEEAHRLMALLRLHALSAGAAR